MSRVVNLNYAELEYRNDSVYTNFCYIRISRSMHLFTRKSSLPRYSRTIYKIPVFAGVVETIKQQLANARMMKCVTFRAEEAPVDIAVSCSTR